MSKPSAKNIDTPDTPAPFLSADFELFLDALDRSDLSAEFGLLMEYFILVCKFNRDVTSAPNTRPPCKGNACASLCDTNDDSSKGVVVWVSSRDKRSEQCLSRVEVDEFLRTILEDNPTSLAEGEALIPKAPISLTAPFCSGESNSSLLRKHSSNDLVRRISLFCSGDGVSGPSIGNVVDCACPPLTNGVRTISPLLLGLTSGVSKEQAEVSKQEFFTQEDEGDGWSAMKLEST
mmetsp:Transcript_20206/g.34422  ORF Transcript_20206/g.34422 Transcript_20206/m.34422 type:complete len:234 (-) Transcript_20206:621-1322(-)